MNQHNPESIQTSDPDKFTSDGMTFRRRGKKYIVRIKFRGKERFLTLADTKAESIRAAKLARKEIREGRWAEFRNSTQLRADHPKTPLSELYKHYRAYPGGLSAHTKEKNIQALDRILRVARPDAGALHIEDLTGDLLWNWKQEVLKSSNLENEERGIQLRRSANSNLRQARSLFAKHALEWFEREAKLHIPETIAGFCQESAFKRVAKLDYHAPADIVMGNTLQALEVLSKREDLSADELNLAKAAWLAIGFGLRAGEIGRAKNADFQRINGDVFFRPIWRAKNKRIPEIGVQLDAWKRLGPWVETQPADAYVLAGTDTERTSVVFRRLSDWMRGFGWQTTHHCHELRAWAGCQIAEKHTQGLLAAQAFMRHSSYGTTQKYYGHHLRLRLDKVQLVIPSIASFQPTIVPSPAQAS